MYEELDDEIERQLKNFDESYEPFKVTFLYNHKNLLYGFIAKGETGFTQYGLDIIAAGVSSLVINTIHSLQHFSDEKVNAEVQRNYSSCLLPKVQQKNRGCIKAIVLLQSLKLGIQTIQNTYGDKYIIIEDIREHNKTGIFGFLK
jgi:uncharacterized protein YsxB (DUF464 family)